MSLHKRKAKLIQCNISNKVERTTDPCCNINVPHTSYAQQEKSDIKRIHTVWLYLNQVLRKGKTIPGGQADWDGILQNILGYEKLTTITVMCPLYRSVHLSFVHFNEYKLKLHIYYKKYNSNQGEEMVTQTSKNCRILTPVEAWCVLKLHCTIPFTLSMF